MVEESGVIAATIGKASASETMACVVICCLIVFVCIKFFCDDDSDQRGSDQFPDGWL
jgi:hypothetical protein